MKNSLMRYVCVFLMFGLAGLVTADIETGLVGYWPFEGDFMDAVGPNHGTPVGDPSFAESLDGLKQCAEMDGDDYLDCGTDSSLDITDAITIACWVKIDPATFAATTWTAFIAKGDDSYRLGEDHNASQLSAHFGANGTAGGGDWVNATTVIADNNWHHVAGVYDGAFKRIYIDGVEDVAQGGYSGPFNSSANPLYIGENSQATGRIMEGLIDEVRVYNRALTPEDMMELFEFRGSSIKNPMPPDNSEQDATVAPALEEVTQLSWDPADPCAVTGPPTYEVFFGPASEPNALLHPKVSSDDSGNATALTVVDGKIAGTTLEAGGLYTWMVRCIDPNDGGNPIFLDSAVWTLLIKPPTPVFTLQPEMLQRRFLGEDVSLTIEVDDQTSTFEWVMYDPNTDTETALTEGERYSGVTTKTLTITGLTEAEFGSYRCIATNAAGPSTSNAGEVLRNILILHFAFDGDTTDSSGFGRDGVFGGTAAVAYAPAAPEINGVTLDLGQAIDLDGVDQHVETSLVASDLNYGGGDTPRTVESWVLTRSFNNGAIWDMGDRSSGNNFCLRTMATTNLWRIQYWGGDQDHTIETDNVWKQLILTYDGAGITQLYANGELVGTFERVINTTDGRTVKIGAYGRNEDAVPGEEGGEYFDGLVADVKFFNYNKSELEIAQEWTAIFGGRICVGGLPSPYDFNGDCVVDVLDFRIFAAAWLDCNLVPLCLE